MGTWSSKITLAAGDPVSVTPVNANFDAIAAILNGNIETANLANLAVTTDKLANSSVTAGKLASAAVVLASMTDDSVDLGNLVGDTLWGGTNTFNRAQFASGGTPVASGGEWTGTSTVTLTPSDNCKAMVVTRMNIDGVSASGPIEALLYCATGGGAQTLVSGTIGYGGSTYGGVMDISFMDLTASTQYVFQPRFKNLTGTSFTAGYMQYVVSVILLPR